MKILERSNRKMVLEMPNEEELTGEMVLVVFTIILVVIGVLLKLMEF